MTEDPNRTQPPLKVRWVKNQLLQTHGAGLVLHFFYNREGTSKMCVVGEGGGVRG